ncbi:MAG TPA: K(+)-transporting ATPase subunit C [Candidatus Binataceae bacterium]|nr:K(+)-transporting ATPase subunit C [Candidatus Binataceae bacterium]
MMRWWVALRMVIVLTVLTGVVYPLIIAGLGGLLFPVQAGGSVIYRDGRAVGSSLIGQNFAAPRYFHPRPSAAGDKGYDADSSGGSNLGPTNKVLIDTVRSRLQAVLKENPGVRADQVPIDLVTASGSGLDPEISPAAAQLQVARVARARGLDPAIVSAQVKAHTRGRWLGIFGEPGVNVLELNLALDRLSAARASAR